MTALAWLLPAALSLGLLALAGFVWALKSGQFEDLDGAAWRALEDDPIETGEGAAGAPPNEARAANGPVGGST